jgi:hypothetical protein
VPCEFQHDRVALSIVFFSDSVFDFAACGAVCVPFTIYKCTDTSEEIAPREDTSRVLLCRRQICIFVLFLNRGIKGNSIWPVQTKSFVLLLCDEQVAFSANVVPLDVPLYGSGFWSAKHINSFYNSSS